MPEDLGDDVHLELVFLERPTPFTESCPGSHLLERAPESPTGLDHGAVGGSEQPRHDVKIPCIAGLEETFDRKHGRHRRHLSGREHPSRRASPHCEEERYKEQTFHVLAGLGLRTDLALRHWQQKRLASTDI